MVNKADTNEQEAISAGSNGLPDGWATSTIGEVYEVNPRKVPADALPSDAPVTFVPMPAVDADSGAITEPEMREFAAVRKGYTSFIEDDVIVAKITPCMENGKAAIARGLTNCHGFGSSEFHVLRSSGAALPEYVYHFVRQESFRREAESRMTGSVGQKRVPPTFVSQHEFPLPPIAEQKRIVAKVEALLKRVNKARERLDRVPDILKKFRQSVLAAACSGRLTADWREENPDVESAEVMVDIIQGLRTAKCIREFPPTVKGRSDLPKIPDSWCWTTFGFVMKDLQNGISTKPNLHPPGVPILRISAVRAGNVLLDDHRFLEATDDLVERYTLVDGDLLFTRYNGSLDLLGVCGMARGVGERTVLHPDKLMRVRFDHDYVDKDYIELFFGTPFARDRMTAKSKSSAGQQGVSGKDVKQQLVALPPKVEQHEIVRRVRKLICAMNGVGEHVAVAIGRSESITQAVLAKAFAGELVETEADLARREGRDYEPASVLLERIAGRVATTTAPVQVEKGRAILDILLLLEAWDKPVSISALEPALVLMRNEAARQTLLNGVATRRQKRSLAKVPSFVRGLDTIYQGLVANGAVRRVGKSGFQLANSELLAKATSADRARAAETLQAIQTLSTLRSLPKVVAAITNERYEITV